jgi:hypothetical protein
MRLLRRKSNSDFSLTKDLIDNIPPYAILSHTWGPDTEEVTFRDMMDGTGKSKAGYNKIRFCGEQAERDGLKYFWVDTCCINKADFTELSEAINSMFRWYQDAAICYAYLIDVTKESSDKQFASSKWFTRGWTLQELIAPSRVVFFNRNWICLGSKESLARRLSNITAIDIDTLRDAHCLYNTSISRRMSWVSQRRTTRVEDTAYALLGIFKVNMPLLYGEGINAFVRLQEEIMKVSADHSIFAWNFKPEHWDGFPAAISSADSGLLAPSPTCFKNSAAIDPVQNVKEVTPYMMTNKGLQITMPVVEIGRMALGLIGCRFRVHYCLGIALSRVAGEDHFQRMMFWDTDREYSWSTLPVPIHIAAESTPRSIYISRGSDREQLSMETMYHDTILLEPTPPSFHYEVVHVLPQTFKWNRTNGTVQLVPLVNQDKLHAILVFRSFMHGGIFSFHISLSSNTRNSDTSNTIIKVLWLPAAPEGTEVIDWLDSCPLEDDRLYVPCGPSFNAIEMHMKYLPPPTSTKYSVSLNVQNIFDQRIHRLQVKEAI